MGRADQNLLSDMHFLLLEKISNCGSITQAAKAVWFSYKGAWDAVDAMNGSSASRWTSQTGGNSSEEGFNLLTHEVQSRCQSWAVAPPMVMYVEKLISTG